MSNNWQYYDELINPNGQYCLIIDGCLIEIVPPDEAYEQYSDMEIEARLYFWENRSALLEAAKRCPHYSTATAIELMISAALRYLAAIVDTLGLSTQCIRESQHIEDDVKRSIALFDALIKRAEIEWQ